MTPRASIITLNWNGLADTTHCLRSILEHSPHDIEIIVWDNGSHGDDVTQLRTMFGERIRIVESKKNLGITGGYNGAAKVATGNILIFINNDTEVTKGWLEPLLETIERDASIAACQPKIRNFFRRDEFDYCGASGGFIDRFGYPFMRGRIFDVTEKDEGQYDSTIDIHWASAACMAITKKAWQEMGGVDEDFFAYMDEIDLCWRLHCAGYRIKCVPSSLIYHKGAATMGKYPARKRFYEHRNNVLMLLKNLPLLDFLWRLPIRLFLELVAIGYYIIRGYFAAAWGAFLALVSLPFWTSKFLLKRQLQTRVMPLARFSVVGAFFFKDKTKFSEIKAL